MMSAEEMQEWSEDFLEGVSPEDQIRNDEDFEDHEHNETWPITQRDRPLSNAAAIGVMDHAQSVLATRLVPENEALDTTIFVKTLPRFMNSEIEIGKRIAFGMFADIFLVKSWKDAKSVKPCKPEQIEAAAVVMQRYAPEDVVIKVLRPTLLIRESLYGVGAADILTEGTLLATLDHPHIVKIIGRSVPSVEGFASGKRDAFFLVLERLHCNMIDMISQWRDRASERRYSKVGIKARLYDRTVIMFERVDAMRQLADAMVYLHSKHIIHRDLKLSNIGIDPHGRIKLIDFGLAKVLPPHNIDKDTFKMTANTGSIRYMAPEISRGDMYGLKADVYSFSILLYEVLNLEKIWPGLQPQDIITKVVTRKQRPAVSLFWPAPMRDLVKSTWSDTPAGRLSMVHVLSILEKQAKQLNAEITPVETNGSSNELE